MEQEKQPFLQDNSEEFVELSRLRSQKLRRTSLPFCLAHLLLLITYSATFFIIHFNYEKVPATSLQRRLI